MTNPYDPYPADEDERFDAPPEPIPDGPVDDEYEDWLAEQGRPLTPEEEEQMFEEQARAWEEMESERGAAEPDPPGM
jgi:hypothetical protein